MRRNEGPNNSDHIEKKTRKTEFLTGKSALWPDPVQRGRKKGGHSSGPRKKADKGNSKKRKPGTSQGVCSGRHQNWSQRGNPIQTGRWESAPHTQPEDKGVWCVLLFFGSIASRPVLRGKALWVGCVGVVGGVVGLKDLE